MILANYIQYLLLFDVAKEILQRINFAFDHILYVVVWFLGFF